MAAPADSARSPACTPIAAFPAPAPPSLPTAVSCSPQRYGGRMLRAPRAGRWLAGSWFTPLLRRHIQRSDAEKRGGRRETKNENWISVHCSQHILQRSSLSVCLLCELCDLCASALD